MQQKHILVAICIALLLHSSIGAQRWVSTSGSDSADCTSSISPCATLRYALQVSGSGDTISIAAGTYTGANFIELVVPSGITIKGAGIDSTIIDLASAGRAFIFDGVVGVSVSAMTLKRGSASGYGGSSLLTGGCAMMVNADVNITDVKFDACRANGNSNNAPAGAIYVDRNSTATIERSQFINCRAGIAGAMFVTQSEVTLRDTIFVGCMSGEGGWGGALVPEEGSKLLIEGCTFRDGYSNFGGGIDDGGSAIYTVRNTLFQNNSALYGGGIYTFGSTRSVIENCTFLGNIANNAGGGIRTTTNSVSTIKNCVFSGNSAGSGGGVSSFSDSLTVIQDSYFYDNYAQQQGGGLAASGPTLIQNSVFDACRSGFISAAVDFVGSLNLTMVDTVLKNNRAFRGAAFSGESGEVSTYHLRNCTFDNNVATSSAGAIIIGGQAIVDLDGAVFTNNEATNGGAIQTTVGSQLYLTNAKFIGNSASYGGAVYFSDQSKAVLSNVDFEANSAIFFGGAVYQDALSQPAITDSRFFNNSARSGGAYALSQYVTSCVDMSGIEFSSNQANIGGGALFFQVTDSSICDFSLGTDLCNSCSFSDNSALFGNDLATSSSKLQFSTSPPSSLASSELFTIDVQVIDMFAQTVKQARDLLVQVSVTEDAVLKGVVEQEVGDNGVAQFKLLKILASPESVVSVNFKTIPTGPQDVNFTIVISQCNEGSEAYLVDAEYHCLQVNDVKQPLRISIYILASVLIVMSVALLIILIVKRNHSVIRKASPVLCWVIVVGAIICYMSTYFWLQSGDGFCVMRVWLLCLGFAMMYGSFFAKEWRLWRLFTVKSVKPMTIRDATLLKAVAILVSIEATVMLFWFIFFPYLENVVIDLESSTENITYQCYSSTPGFLYALLAFNCALLLFGCFLAIKTRKLPQNYNESKHLAFSIYNATLTLFVVVPVASVLADPDSIAIAVTAGILFETTMSLLILFAPKMYLTLNEGVILATLKKQAEKLQNDLLWKRKQIAEFEKNGTIEMDIGSTSTPPTANSATDVRGQSEIVTMRTMGPLTDSKN